MRSDLRLSTSADVRVHLGLTQQQLANSLGISRSTLALAETGRRPMPASAEPMLLEMRAIATVMPAPSGAYKRMRKNNRVASQARLHTLTKKPIVTAQAAKSRDCTQRVRTSYPSRANRTSTFSTHLLGHTDCQTLLNELPIKQDRMRSQLDYLQLETRAAVTRGQELQVQLTLVNTMLQVNRELIETFPFASGKRKWEHRNAKLHCKRLVLEDRLEHFDAAAMLLREYNINVMVKQLALLENLIAAVEKRNGELNQPELIDSVLPEPTPAYSDDDRRIRTGGTVILAVACQAA